MRILIVDDNPDDRRLLRYMVEKHGHEAIEAEHGVDGLQKARAHAPDLILSDALMPVMDGFQFLRALTRERPLCSVPFAFYSSSYKDDQDVRLAMSLGARAYFIKPVEPVELWSRIEGILRAEEAAGAAPVPMAPPPPPLLEEDLVYLKNYSEVVATKLEQKVRELEQTLDERTRAEEALHVSEEKYRTIFEESFDGIFISDPEGRVLDINRKGVALLGYDTKEDVQALHLARDVYANPSDLQRILEAVDGNGTAEFEVEVRRKAGETILAHCAMTVVRDPMDRPVSYRGIIRDISELKKAERERLANLLFLESMDRVNRALQETNDFEHTMREVLEIVLAIFACDRTWLTYPCLPDAPSWRVMADRSRPEYSSPHVAGVDFPMDSGYATMTKALRDADRPVAFDPGSPWQFSPEVQQRAGFRSLLAVALYPKVGHPWVFGLHQCSCARVWTPEEERLLQEIGRRLSDSLTGILTYRDLRKSEEFLNSIIENIPNMLFVKDAASLRFVRFNRAGEQLLGCSREELIGRCDHDIFPKEVADFFSSKDREALGMSGALDIPEECILTRSHEERFLHTKKLPIVDSEGKPQYLLGISEDITDRKRAVETLRERETFIRNILHSVGEGFIVLDRQYRILSANRAFCNLVGMSEEQVLGQPCYAISRNVDRPCFETGQDCAIKRTFDQGIASVASHVLTDKHGDKQYLEIRSYPVTDATGHVTSVIETITDITARKALEDQLRQAQKMEAIGNLAGGVAHDFNNILTAIMGFATLARMKMPPDGLQRPYLDQILSCSERAAHLTQSLLAFSRRQVISPRPVNLNQIVQSIEAMFRRLIGEDIELSVKLSEKELRVMADVGQIDQVLMNLATNGRDAMPQGGRLTITTQETELHEDFVRLHGSGPPGKYAWLTVSDTGCGMDEATRSKIFEPFFTTKELGKGTGLGLAIVYGIVQQHNGSITVHSEPGAGTTFHIHLPLIASQAEEPAAAPLAPPRGGSETILLAEDDAQVRDMTRTVLEDFGYRVITAVDGLEAIEEFRAHGADVDLILLDVVMPRACGREVYDAARAIRPGVKVLFTSGYTADIIHTKSILEEGMRFVTKPITPINLLRKVREVLDDKGPQG